METTQQLTPHPKALILVGGFGTRLRPLTLSKPKPLLDFCGKPLLLHQLEALKECGVKEVVLALSYMPDGFHDFLDKFEKELDMTIYCSQESEPLGTAGPLALAKELLLGTSNDQSEQPVVRIAAQRLSPAGSEEATVERTENLDSLSHGYQEFFMLNSDVICDFPLKGLLHYHRIKKAEATLMVTKVTDPSKYGVVVMEANGAVKEFVEKPKTFVGDNINAGIYVLNSRVLQRIQLKPTSIEKDVFPQIAQENNLYALEHNGFWMDVGQPKDFITGCRLYLSHLRNMMSPQCKLATGSNIVGNVYIHPTAKVADSAVIGPDTYIGPNCIIESGARIAHSILMDGSKVCISGVVLDSIIGWHCKIGKWARVGEASVLGEDVYIRDQISVSNAKILPHKEIKDNVNGPSVIM